MHPLLQILPHVEHFSVLWYWFVFFSAFLESFVAVGLIYPGSFVVIFFGFLASQGSYDFGDLIWFSAIGLILGDISSFYLGGKGTHLFRGEEALLQWPFVHRFLDKGEAFFERHGSKSVFLSHFIGPLGAVVPFIAGLSKMNPRSFIFWSILTGFAWAIAHLLVGYFFGGTFSAVRTLMGQ